MYKLLIIDDDRDLLQLHLKYFTEHGFSTRCALSAKEGLKIFQEFEPDCVILDVMMPHMDGFEVCHRIRQVSSVPIIFLTGRVTEDDKVKGLLLGGDDYVEKPYSFRELEARVLVNSKRGASIPDDRLSFPPLEIDVIGHHVFCNGENINLSKQEYELLHLLATSGSALVTYEQIGKLMWGTYRTEDRRAIMVGVSRLRKKLEHNPITARMIETVWSQGYRFVGEKGGYNF